MAIGKPRGKTTPMYPVYVHVAGTGKKKYVGQRATLREARLLEAKKQIEFSDVGAGGNWTVAGWIGHWLDHHHGPGTSRPDPQTRAHNDQATRQFINVYGGRKLSSIDRPEALGWAKKHFWQAKVIAAAFADAVRMDHLGRNVWSKLGLEEPKGRADIFPLTEKEIDQLCDVAVATHGRIYGPEFAALIRFAAWTGLRPGELVALEWTEVDLAAGEAHIWWSRSNTGDRKRTKTGQNRTIQLAPQAAEALQSIARPHRGPVFLSKTGKPLRQNSLTGSAGLWTPVRTTFQTGLPANHWLQRRIRQDDTKPLVPYELRHFCASVLADRGLTAREIAKHLGNTPEVCEVYIHLYEDRVKDRIKRAFASDTVRELRPVGSDLGSEATG